MSEKKKVPPGFQKGQSGNPNGRPPLPPEIRNLKKLTVEQLEQVISDLLHANDDTHDKILADRQSPYLQRIIVQILRKTYDTGNMTQFDLLLNRLIGKVKEKFVHEIVKPSVLIKKDGTQVEFSLVSTKKEES